MIVDASSFIRKLEKIKIDVPLSIKRRLAATVQEIAEEVANPDSSYWRQPSYFSGPYKGQKYFSKQSLAHGLFDALADVKSTIFVSIDNNSVLFGIGNITDLDGSTRMEKGTGGYWRLFEGYEPYYGSRVGKSSEYHFNPNATGSSRPGSEGAMQKGGFHPGVESAHMFTSTLKAYNTRITNELRQAIKEGLNAQ